MNGYQAPTLQNLESGLLFPVLNAAVGLSSTFFIFVGFGVLSLIFVKKYVPETKGRSLEEIE